MKKQIKQAKEHFTKQLEAATVAVMKAPTPAATVAVRANTKDTTAAEKPIKGILGHRNIEKVLTFYWKNVFI